MIPINVTFGRRLITGALALALGRGRMHIRQPRTHGSAEATCRTNPQRRERPTQPLGTPNATTGSARHAGRRPRRRRAHLSRRARAHLRHRLPAATVDPAIAAQIDQVIAQVPPIRMLQPTKTVPYQIISRDDFQSYLLSTADEDTTPEWRTAEQNFFKRLGLLPQDADLNALLLQLYTSEVAAYYNPDDGTFYIIDRNAPFGPIDEVTTAHEYTHALQDQHFDLEGNRIKDPAEGDAVSRPAERDRG